MRLVAIPLTGSILPRAAAPSAASISRDSASRVVATHGEAAAAAGGRRSDDTGKLHADSSCCRMDTRRRTSYCKTLHPRVMPLPLLYWYYTLLLTVYACSVQTTNYYILLSVYSPPTLSIYHVPPWYDSPSGNYVAMQCSADSGWRTNNRATNILDD